LNPPSWSSPRREASIPEDAEDLIDAAEYVVVDTSCFEGQPPSLRTEHSLLVKRNASKVFRAYEIWARGTLERVKARPSPASDKEKETEAPDDEAGGP